jgi:N-acetylmuramoyl-L-alanine amidase
MRDPAFQFVRLLACAALAACGAAHAAEIRSVKLTPEADHTRATFELTGKADYKLFAIGNPDRVVLDVDGAGFAPGFSAPDAAGLLKSLRTGKHGKDGARVVFDLEGAVQPKSFLLAPSDGAGYRLIVDLYKKGKVRGAVKSAAALAVKPRDIVIAVDPGHGGVDPGATGSSGTREKDITLAVARELKRQIDAQQGMRAVLTRDGDVFVPLAERYQKARNAKADLFVSVHADAYASGDARGSSVWMLSSRGATSQAARWLADRENEADLVGGVKLEDKDHTLAAVLLDLSQGATLEASGAVAQRVLRSLGRIGPTHRGYVEKANFVVLRSPDVPSILVETAFITNPLEERRLNSAAQREKLASAILEGARDYFRSTPPPGTWFAVNNARDKSEQGKSEQVATRRAPAKVAVIAQDDPDREELLARGPRS